MPHPRLLPLTFFVSALAARISLLRPATSPASALALAPASPPPRVYRSASSVPDPPPPPEPFVPSALDDFLLAVFRWTLQRQSGVTLPDAPGFEGMVAELHELRRTRGVKELERVSLRTMTALAGPVPSVYRALFAGWGESPSLLAWSASVLLPFLVGDMTQTSAGGGDDGGDGRGGGLLVERCRVLEGSGCKGICARMCKVPTERFFAERWGVPLSMEPNFETGACQLRFGVVPTDLANDPTIPPGCLRRCPAFAASVDIDTGSAELC